MSSSNETVCHEFDDECAFYIVVPASCALIFAFGVYLIRWCILYKRGSNVKYVRIQVYHPQRNARNAVFMVIMGLVKAFNKMMIHILFDMITSPDEVKNGNPLFIICVNESRLGTDANGIIHQIKDLDLESAILLVIHPAQEFAQSSISSSESLVSPQFKRLSAIIDITYKIDRGFFACNMNTKAVTDILKYVERFVQKL